MSVTLMAADEVKQRHVDRFFAEMRKTLPAWRSLPLTEAASAYVRSATAAGLLLGVDGPVDEMSPSEVVRLAGLVDDLLAGVLTIPNA